MKSARIQATGWVFAGIIALLYSATASSQNTEGNNAVCTSQTGCSTTLGTTAFIDASQFVNANQGSDICDAIFGIFVNKWNVATYPSSGAVVDARGIGGSALKCTKGSPWTEGSTTVAAPANILLPAGTILIPTPWVLPASTHLFGQGDNPSSGTVIQACTSKTCANPFSGTAMIQFGASQCAATGCAAESVEKLVLDGQGQQIGGIVNQYSQSNSYVDHVSQYRILGTGLLIEATGSGPYSNINFDTGNTTATTSTVCAQILGTTGTAGIRGLTCTSELGRVAQTTGFVSFSRVPRPSSAWAGIFHA
jgi:hypothetical protein